MTEKPDDVIIRTKVPRNACPHCHRATSTIYNIIHGTCDYCNWCREIVWPIKFKREGSE